MYSKFYDLSFFYENIDWLSQYFCIVIGICLKLRFVPYGKDPVSSSRDPQFKVSLGILGHLQKRNVKIWLSIYLCIFTNALVIQFHPNVYIQFTMIRVTAVSISNTEVPFDDDSALEIETAITLHHCELNIIMRSCKIELLVVKIWAHDKWAWKLNNHEEQHLNPPVVEILNSR